MLGRKAHEEVRSPVQKMRNGSGREPPHPSRRFRETRRDTFPQGKAGYRSLLCTIFVTQFLISRLAVRHIIHAETCQSRAPASQPLGEGRGAGHHPVPFIVPPVPPQRLASPRGKLSAAVPREADD